MAGFAFRINPKVGQVELSQLLTPNFVRNLEESGFLAEARKKMKGVSSRDPPNA
jgi:hypothetical protein